MEKPGTGNHLLLSRKLSYAYAGKWETIADRLSKAGWSWECVSRINSKGQKIVVLDAHRDDGKRFIVHSGKKLSAFVELERQVLTAGTGIQSLAKSSMAALKDLGFDLVPDLAPFCIYTIRSSTALREALKRGSGNFIEGKRWVSALGILDRAKKKGQQLPIVFAHSEHIDGVRYSAVIDELDVSPADERGTATTTVSFSELRRLRKKEPLNALRLKSSGQPLSKEFIRPYAICHTPDFL